MAPRGRRRETVLTYQERVLRALVIVERNPSRAPTLDALAREACLSPFHFHRVFAAVVGEGPAEYARRLRLDEAAHELTTGDASIAAIASRAGYARQESFTRAFRAQFGETPSAFRKARRRRSAPPALSSRVGRVETITPLRVAFIRHVGPYEEVPAQFERLARWAGKRVRRRGQATEPLFLGMALDDPGLTPPAKLRFDCCVAVTDDVTRGEGDVGIQVLPGGRYAVALHRGSFATLASTYGWLARDFVPREGLTLRRAPAIELYLTSPDPKASDGLTEVLLPVQSPPE